MQLAAKAWAKFYKKRSNLDTIIYTHLYDTSNHRYCQQLWSRQALTVVLDQKTLTLGSNNTTKKDQAFHEKSKYQQLKKEWAFFPELAKPVFEVENFG